jgi:peptidoglycan-associated lipoprotein
MQTRWTILATFLAGLGCSHAKPTGDEAARMPDRSNRQNTNKQLQAKSGAAASGQDSQPTQDRSIYFTFDSFQMDPDGKGLLQSVAREAKSTGREIRVEGNCDERGTTEYNLALGDRRAQAAATYLQRLGISVDKIVSVSYGSERPKEPGHDESAWSRNRRDDVVLR